MRNKVLFILLALILLAGCTQGTGREEMPETVTYTIPAEVTEPVPATEFVQETIPIQETEPVPVQDTRIASGNLQFWIDGFSVRAGGPVSDIVAIGVTVGVDLTDILDPGQISGNISARVDREGVPADEEPLFFFHAINTSADPMMISQCAIYSLAVNLQNGILFESTDPDAPFVTGITTINQIIDAFGEPDYYRSNGEPYEEIAYYAPFDSLYFSFKDGIVRQIGAVYADMYRGAEDYECGTYFGNDALVLLQRFLDVGPYLTDGYSEVREPAQDLQDTIILGDMEIQLGCMFDQLPGEFTQAFHKAPFFLASNHYVLAGKGRGEEFYLLNQKRSAADSYKNCTVIGLVTHNANYSNWGSDYRDFLPFRYQGLDNESGIGDILSLMGQPQEIHVSSSFNVCFAWLHYRDRHGNELQLRVDPMTGKLAELRILMFYPDANMYR